MDVLKEKSICGIVMPISEIDGCSESHWTDVIEIIKESIEQAGFSPNLVSNADDAGIIHKRIIQNLYDNPVVVCDVSCKNPNVMFELGMRLAFDKPTIIVKDDRTSYSFDTSAIEHIEYPRDLRFSRIVEFKSKLAAKIIATHDAATKDSNYTTFLKHFGEFTVAKLQKKLVPAEEYILEELKSIKSELNRFRTRTESHPSTFQHKTGRLEFSISANQKTFDEAIKKIMMVNGVNSMSYSSEKEGIPSSISIELNNPNQKATDQIHSILAPIIAS